MNTTTTINTATLQLEILEAERIAERNRMILGLHQQLLELKGQLAERDASIAKLREDTATSCTTADKSDNQAAKQTAGGARK